MRKSIGEVIRELRKQENMTQEKLAEALNVSFQSVSRWENNLAYPDISLIPVIANYFNITTDMLFDMEYDENSNKKARYEDLYKEFRKKGELKKCMDIMVEARKEFPRDYHIMMNLAEIMDLHEGGTKAQKEEFVKEKYSGQIFSLCQRILEECREEGERYRAIKLLSEYYVKTGNNSEALHLIQGVADMAHCRELLLEKILSGEEKRCQLQSNMLQAVDYTATTMVKMAVQKEYGFTGSLALEEKIQYIETANKLYSLLMPDGNFQAYHRNVGWNYRRLAELYLLKEDKDTAFDYLLAAEKEATKYDELQDYRYTAVFVNTLENKPEQHYKSWIGSERVMLLYRIKEMQGYFGPHKGVEELLGRLEQATQNEKEITIE